MSEHTDVAAYSLGLLEADDQQEFEAHLSDCPSCTTELAELSGMASVFAGVEPVQTGPVAPDEAAVTELISRRAAARRRGVRQRLVFAAAASVVLLGGGIAGGLAAAPGQTLPVAQAQGQQHSATDAQTGVSGTVHLVAKPFGTQITLDLSGVHGPLDCQLIAVSKTGQRSVAVNWRVPAAGYGVPGHPMHLVITGGTAIMPQNLSRVNVDVVGGSALLSIQV